MEDYKRYKEFKPGTKCSVPDCSSPALFEVVLFDYYPSYFETFYEQDFTCPFICEFHMHENESEAVGKREPRGYVEYPYTNRDHAQGYSKYNPIKEVYPLLHQLGRTEDNRELQIDLREINEELISHLAKHPELMRELNPRKFEILIAELFKAKGFEVTLTPPTRDGGKDIIALYKSPFGHQLYIVECKRYQENNRVGVEIVRSLYGVKTHGHYNQAILVTTSSFTKDAIDFVKPLNLELSLKDLADVQQWCKDHGMKK